MVTFDLMTRKKVASEKNEDLLSAQSAFLSMLFYVERCLLPHSELALHFVAKVGLTSLIPASSMDSAWS